MRTEEQPAAGPVRDKINPRSLTEVFNQIEKQPLQMKKIPYKTFEKKSFAQLPSCSPPRIQEEEIPHQVEELCETEENEFKNEINPIKLADLGWCEDYKLIKIYNL